MISYTTIAIPTDVAEQVRLTGKDPRYGHPTHTELAKGYGPCRHCLKTFVVGEESRTLFTYDSFSGVEVIPLPGPIFIHTEQCTRYPEQAGYPQDLRAYSAILTAYATGQVFIERRYADKGEHDQAIEQLLENPLVDYIEVRDKSAGCYDFRIERT